MTRLCQDFAREPFFDDAAGVHHSDALGHLRDDAEIVGDEEKTELQFAAEAVEQIQDLLLHRDVERRCGFIRDQESRPGCQRRHGNHR